MIAPPGYPNISSTPCSSRTRHINWAPVRTSVTSRTPCPSHPPQVARVQRARLQPIGMARLVERVDEGPGARLDDVGGGTLPAQRLSVHPGLEEHLAHAVPPRRHRAELEADHLHLPAQDLADRGERRRDRPG